MRSLPRLVAAIVLAFVLFWLVYSLANFARENFQQRGLNLITDGLASAWVLSALIVIIPIAALLWTLFPELNELSYTKAIKHLEQLKSFDEITKSLENEETAIHATAEVASLIANIAMAGLWLLYGLIITGLWFFLGILLDLFPLSSKIEGMMGLSIRRAWVGMFPYIKTGDRYLIDLNNYVLAFAAILILAVLSLGIRKLLQKDLIRGAVYCFVIKKA